MHEFNFYYQNIYSYASKNSDKNTIYRVGSEILLCRDKTSVGNTAAVGAFVVIIVIIIIALILTIIIIA